MKAIFNKVGRWTNLYHRSGSGQPNLMVIQLGADLILNAHITCKVAIQAEFYFTEYAEEEKYTWCMCSLRNFVISRDYLIYMIHIPYNEAFD